MHSTDKYSQRSSVMWLVVVVGSGPVAVAKAVYYSSETCMQHRSHESMNDFSND